MVSKLAIALISPLGTALVLALLGLGLTRWARRIGTLLAFLALAWLWLWSTPAASEWLEQRTEAAFPPQRVEEVPFAPAIVVLGGGVVPPTEANRYPDLNQASDRVWHAARLFRAGKASLIFLSGGSDPEISAMSEAKAMRALLVDLGVPPARIVLEERSRNTRENAEFTAPLLRDYRVQRVLLVTSALHMHRAVAEFERAGVQVIPAPTDHSQRTVGGARLWVPDTGALDTASRTMKELVGRALVTR
ncbi:YdcF family protein [Ramlibacter sp. USB13]|uniref:YdcF family protein n=1 Tax=Ramlibacter cellulosilyticus TaxID=2764187 RepID=A0A923SCE1_9BURK|nr:YdcF family protein [Ramlibacter cellulosilyticus]MBC5784855.1 YdcF family protein [Ramlibacter cellulosilyticus]